MRTLTRTLVCLLTLAGTTPSTVPAEVSKGGQDGRLVLENSYVRAAIDPAKGAALVSFVVKPGGKERLAGPSFVDANVLPARRFQDLGGLGFIVTESEDAANADEAVWELSAALPKEAEIAFWHHLVGRMGEAITYNPPAVLEWPRPYENLKLTKRYRLRSDSRALIVEYEATNTGDRAVELCLATTHQFAGASLCVPTRDGAAAFDIPLPDRDRYPCFQYSAAPWFYDVPAAWTATLSEDGTAIAGCFDPRHVSFLQPNVETGKVVVGRTRVRIEPGATFKTSSWLMPVAGLAATHGAANELCAGFQVTPPEADGKPPLIRRELAHDIQAKIEQLDITLDMAGGESKAKPPEDEDEDDPFDKPDLTEDQIEAELEGLDPTKVVKTKYKGGPINVRLSLDSARDRSAEISFRTRKNPRGEWRDLGTRPAKLAAGKPASLELILTPKTMGTHVVEATVRDGGKEIARFTHPVVAGHRSGPFLPEAPAPEGEINKEFYYRNVGGWPMWP